MTALSLKRWRAWGRWHSSSTLSTSLRWLTGQGDIPVLPEEKRNFRVFMKFNQNLSYGIWQGSQTPVLEGRCHATFPCALEDWSLRPLPYGVHAVFYPTVTACLTACSAYAKIYDEFKHVMTKAFHYGVCHHMSQTSGWSFGINKKTKNLLLHLLSLLLLLFLFYIFHC